MFPGIRVGFVQVSQNVRAERLVALENNSDEFINPAQAASRNQRAHGTYAEENMQ